MLNSADVTSGADNIVYRLENYSANIGLIQVKEEGWTGFSEGWQGCSEGNSKTLLLGFTFYLK